MAKSAGSGLYDRIYAAIRRVPCGRVSTYGWIARQVGGCGARQVGYALAALPDGNDVPWHRIINSRGEISRRGSSDGDSLQRILLEAEDIGFSDKDRVDLQRFGWYPPEDDRSPPGNFGK
jgi:methylated-DNA-protein-cysteine methyltransferase-like protein